MDKDLSEDRGGDTYRYIYICKSKYSSRTAEEEKAG